MIYRSKSLLQLSEFIRTDHTFFYKMYKTLQVKLLLETFDAQHVTVLQNGINVDINVSALRKESR